MRTLKILHVDGILDYGGVEIWLMHVLRRLERARFQIDVLTLLEGPGVFDDEARGLGCRVLPCPGYRRPWQFARNFQRIVQAHGPYDIIHCHLQEYAGLVLALARQARIPVRIAHSHGDGAARGARAGLPRRLYRAALRRLIARHATLRLAVSARAASALFGQDGRPWRYLPCGIDLAPFAAPGPRAKLRADLGIPAGALLAGHVGRMVREKNHRLLVEIAAALATRCPASHMLLVGDGPLRPAVERQIARRGLAGRVTLAGARPDVAALLAAMDVFVMPSLHEGLGLAAVEAQAAGLPCVLSDAVPPEVAIVAPLVRRVALASPADAWADAVLSAGRAGGAIDRASALAQVRDSPLNIEQSIAALRALYEERWLER